MLFLQIDQSPALALADLVQSNLAAVFAVANSCVSVSAPNPAVAHKHHFIIHRQMPSSRPQRSTEKGGETRASREVRSRYN